MKANQINRREFNLSLLAGAGAILYKPAAFQSSSSLRVNSKRISDHLVALAEFGKNPQGGVSRVAYSEADRLGRAFVIGLMRAAKLDTSIDAAGNIIGRRAGSDS